MAIIACLAATVCSCEVDYAYEAELEYVNQTDHDVTLTIVSSRIPFEVTLNPGKSYTEKHSEEGPINFEALDIREASMTFDGKYTVTFKNTDEKDSAHNICHEEDYTVSNQEKRLDKYTFAITEEDYSYAVSVNANN